MIYPFLTLDDETEIVHPEMKPTRSVKVYLEKPDEKEIEALRQMLKEWEKQ